MAYYQLEPYGDEWLRTGLLASTIAEPNRDRKKHPKPFTPIEFIPSFGTSKPKQSTHQILSNVWAWKSVLDNKYKR